jgi:hypothetical protein
VLFVGCVVVLGGGSRVDGLNIKETHLSKRI